MTPDATLVLFAYGSLKRGRAHHAELAGARFVAATSTARSFALREIDGYPALVPGERAIVGELFEVSPAHLPALDDFEGTGYVRRAIELADGTTAIAYLARDPDAGTALAATEWLGPTSRP